MTVSFAHNGDIALAYETFGSQGRPLLLIQGGLAPMQGWPDDFCEALARKGFHVARYDNRDTGQSSRTTADYTLADSAADGTAVLDALGWPGAHVVGVSLGGMIAQVMATRHADRVLSLTSLSSAPDHLQRWNLRKVRTLVKFAAAHRKRPRDPESAGEHLVRIYRIVGSPGHPHDEDWIRSVGRRNFRTRTDFAAFRRQGKAMYALGDRRAELAGVRAPTLVITGEADPVQPVSAGRATADAIPGAKFVTYAGMGHDLPRPLWPDIIGEIDAIAGR
ncbi:alpha/beta fold hydrolase [Amycolatopsis sp. NPDC054798]